MIAFVILLAFATDSSEQQCANDSPLQPRDAARRRLRAATCVERAFESTVVPDEYIVTLRERRLQSEQHRLLRRILSNFTRNDDDDAASDSDKRRRRRRRNAIDDDDDVDNDGGSAWRLVVRNNAATAFPTDFALLKVMFLLFVVARRIAHCQLLSRCVLAVASVVGRRAAPELGRRARNAESSRARRVELRRRKRRRRGR